MQALALIDYDNFRRRHRKSKHDLEFDTRTLVDDVACAFVKVFPSAKELDIRLYGGWTNPAGLPSRDASWLYELLPDLRGRRHGLIVRPTLATTLIQFPTFVLRGTIRGEGIKMRQKMVDGMISCDVLHMASHGQTYIGVVTDDDDLVPAALIAHCSNADVLVWMRTRSAGSAINDPSLLIENMRFHKFREA